MGKVERANDPVDGITKFGEGKGGRNSREKITDHKEKRSLFGTFVCSNGHHIYKFRLKTMNSDNIINPECPKTAPVENLQCRICLDKNQKRTLSLPCLCKGDLSVMHETCFHAWIGYSQTSYGEEDGPASVQCEVCKAIIYYQMDDHKECLKADQIPLKRCPIFIPVSIMITLLTVFAVLQLLKWRSNDQTGHLIVAIILFFLDFLFILGTIKAIYENCCVSHEQVVHFLTEQQFKAKVNHSEKKTNYSDF